MSTKRVEIFAVGKWNGMSFSIADLREIKRAFDYLQEQHKVPLQYKQPPAKLGHNDTQALTDGLPALGWVSKLSVEGDKLVADITDIPDIVMTAMDKKLYRNVSVELDMDVAYKDQKFPFVLSGVALLGADIPAVNTLKDLTHYLGRSTDFSVGRRAVFSAIAGEVTGEHNMDEKEFQKLQTQVADLTVKNSDLTIKNAELTAAQAKFTADAKAASDAAAKIALTAKRAEVMQILEDGVKSEAITPAVREKYAKLLKIDDDAAVTALDVAEVKALVGVGTKQFQRATGKGAVDAAEDTREPDVIVLERCREAVVKKEAPDLFAAQALVFQRDPALAAKYITMNGSKS